MEDCSVNIQDYAGFICTCVENIVLTTQVMKFQNPWINSQVRHMLCTLSLAFRSDNETEYKVVKCRLRKAITTAKRQNREKLVGFYCSADPGRMWQHPWAGL